MSNGLGTRMLAGLVALALAVAAGCGDDDDDGATPQSGERETTTTTAPAEPLEILVTNDDGVGGRGHRRPRHRARPPSTASRSPSSRPPTQQSGTGGSATEGPLTTNEAQTASGYEASAVEGFPADTIRVAFDELGLTPDLVVSGINEGQNLGPVVDLSGHGRRGPCRGAPGRPRPGGQPGRRPGPRLRGGRRAGRRLDRGEPRRPRAPARCPPTSWPTSTCRPATRASCGARLEVASATAGDAAGAVRLHVDRRGLHRRRHGLRQRVRHADRGAGRAGPPDRASVPTRPPVAPTVCVIPASRPGRVTRSLSGTPAGSCRHGRRRGPFEIPSSDRPVRHSLGVSCHLVRRPRRARAPVRHPGPSRHQRAVPHPGRHAARRPRRARRGGQGPHRLGQDPGLRPRHRRTGPPTAGPLEPRRPRALVLVPDPRAGRPGAARAHRPHRRAGRTAPVVAIYGGVGYGPQRKLLARGVSAVVACPGRLEDLIATGDVVLDGVDLVVLDEADRMADMGFMPAVRRLLDRTPDGRQTLLFSATLDGDVDKLVRHYQHDPVHHAVAGADDDDVEVDHHFWTVAREERVGAHRRHRAPHRLDHRVHPHPPRRRPGRPPARPGSASRRCPSTAAARQAQRDQALQQFSTGRAPALVATDVAARGIHVDAVGCVVHFDLPDDPKDYVHRSGRTGRAGASGTVVSLVGDDGHQAMRALQRAARPHRADRAAPTSSGCRPPSRRRPSVRCRSPTAPSAPGRERPGAPPSVPRPPRPPRRPRRADRGAPPAAGPTGARVATERRPRRAPAAAPTAATAATRRRPSRRPRVRHGVELQPRQRATGSSPAAVAPTCSCTCRRSRAASQTLEPGQRVRFELAPGRRGQQARNVRAVT